MVHFKTLHHTLYLILLGVGISTGANYPAHAQGLPEYFDVEVSIEPCPEFWLQNMVIDVFYRIGNNPDLIAADIQSQTLDAEARTYTPVIRFPSFYGTTPFSVFAFCRNALGFSDASNPAQVSNCDSLARFDSDGDGIPNHLEDTNCDNFYSPGDASNPFNVDTDGNGVRDLVEVLSGTDPNNPARSPRPSIFSGGSFDINADGISNPLVWRPSNGTWYIQDNSTKGLHTAFQFGVEGDIPFTYRNNNQESDVGVIRNIQNQYHWFFRGKGVTINSIDTPSIVFGIFGDNVILGPWEKPGVTSPAVARLFNGIWTFDILLSDGTVRSQVWGGNGDIPKPQDFDGDGIFDLAVYRPGDQKTYIIPSTNPETALIYDFGSGTAEHTVRGDYTGDGKEDISFWEPLIGTFTSLLSDKGFDTEKAKLKDSDHYREFELGEYFLDLPLSWNTDGTKHLYTIINHQTGVRKFYPANDKSQGLKIIQWGLKGDSQG